MYTVPLNEKTTCLTISLRSSRHDLTGKKKENTNFFLSLCWRLPFCHQQLTPRRSYTRYNSIINPLILYYYYACLYLPSSKKLMRFFYFISFYFPS